MSNNFIVGIGDSGTDVNAGQSVSSNTFIGTLAGNAETANKLNHTLTIGDYTFDGSTNIDITTIPIKNGGTDATTAEDARTNLGITPANIGALSTTNGAVGTNNIADGAITGSKIATETILNANYAPGSITRNKLANDARYLPIIERDSNQSIYITSAWGGYLNYVIGDNWVVIDGPEYNRLEDNWYAEIVNIDKDRYIQFIDVVTINSETGATYENGNTFAFSKGKKVWLKKVSTGLLIGGSAVRPNISGGTSAPSGGNSGDIYIQYS